MLKCFDEENAVELHALSAAGGTRRARLLPVDGNGDGAIIIDDLSDSSEWRLATSAEDVECRADGQGRCPVVSLPSRGGRTFSPVRRGAEFPEAGMRRADCRFRSRPSASSLGLAANPVWELAAAHIEELMTGVSTFPRP